ncbi:MAG: mechanosensitive ion channel family protein [Bacteroidia bacterium]
MLLLFPNKQLRAQNTRDQQLQQIKEISKSRTERRLQEMRQEEEDESVQQLVDSLLIEIKSKMAGQVIGLDGDTIALVYERLGSLTAAERVNLINQKLVKIIESDQYTDSLLLSESQLEVSEIRYGPQVLMVVTDNDALYYGKTRFELVEDFEAKIRDYIYQKREANSWYRVLLKIIWVSLIIALFYLIIKGINRFYAYFNRQLVNWKGRYLTGFRIGTYQLFDDDRALHAAIWLTKAVRILLIIMSFYLLLPVIFSLFPFTRGLADELFGYILNPLKAILRSVIDFVPNLITIVIIFLVTRSVVRFIHFLAGEIDKGELKLSGFYSEWALPTFNIVRFLLYAFMVIVIFPYLPGSDSRVFQGVSVFLGILFSLGSSSAISNMVAGLVITYMRPFRIGDRIKVGDVVGDVLEKDMLVTRIRTPKNEEVTIPNATVLNTATVNYSNKAREEGVILYTSVTIGYDVPWKQVHELLIKAAQRTEAIEKDPAPFVLQTSLDDFYVAYQLNAYTKVPQRSARVYSELHAHIQDAFNEAGVEIMSPHYRAARDGSQTTIPANYLPNDYQAPPFIIKQTKAD